METIGKKYSFILIDAKGTRQEYHADSERQARRMRSEVTKTHPVKILDVSRIIGHQRKLPMFATFIWKNRR